MFDIWGNLPSGILHGSVNSPGHFTECVEFRHDTIQGQHCMITTTANVSTNSNELTETEVIAKEKNLNLVRGVCLPATCSKQRVIEYWNQKQNLHAFEAVCRTNDPIPFNAVDILAV